MLTRSVILEAAGDENEILVVFVDEKLRPVNRLLRDHAELKAKLLVTPSLIPNPARAPLEAEAFAAAEASIAAELANMDSAVSAA